MKLDPRIKEGKKPLDCFDEDIAKQFIGKEGFVTDFLQDFCNLNKVKVSELKTVLHTEIFCYRCDSVGKKYFLPVEWVKEPETPKFVPYTLDTWEQEFKSGDVVFFKGKEDTGKEKNYYKCMYLGHLENEKNRILVILGRWLFAFDELINSFEIYRNGNWEPFGKNTKEGE